MDNAIVDGDVRPLQISLTPDREVKLSLSHFWSYAAIDPGMSIFIFNLTFVSKLIFVNRFRNYLGYGPL
jgi:hypothetical protein